MRKKNSCSLKRNNSNLFLIVTGTIVTGIMILMCWGSTTSVLLANEPAKSELRNSNYGLFSTHEPLRLELKYHVSKFKKDKGPKRGYHPAKLSYTDRNDKQVSLDVRIKVRGKLRRQLLRCLVPPFKIKFDLNQTKGTLFENQKSLKLVVHCKNKPSYYQHYTLQEYLIYRIYNLLTDLSFRVRLVSITYIDENGKKNPFTKYAFFIESHKELAKRNNGKTVDMESISLPQADIDASTLTSVFEYMIGNTDWSIRSSHNVKLITIGNENKYYPIPFDFDQAGLIDAHYARPDLRLPIKSVRERLFRGYCKSETQFQKTFEIFKKHKKAIYALFENFAPLPEKIRTRNIKYLEEFFDIIDNPKLVNRYFIDNYRGRPLPLR